MTTFLSPGNCERAQKLGASVEILRELDAADFTVETYRYGGLLTVVSLVGYAVGPFFNMSETIPVISATAGLSIFTLGYGLNTFLDIDTPGILAELQKAKEIRSCIDFIFKEAPIIAKKINGSEITLTLSEALQGEEYFFPKGIHLKVLNTSALFPDEKKAPRVGSKVVSSIVVDSNVCIVTTHDDESIVQTSYHKILWSQ